MTIFTQKKPAGTPTWFDLMTPDPDKARAFYSTLFGWKYEISGPEMAFYSMAIRDGQMAAGIGPTMPGTQMPSAWTMYFATDDAAKDAERVKALGGSVMMTMPIPEMGIQVVCADPTGAAFGMWQSARHIGATVSDVHGAMTWCDVHTREMGVAVAFYSKLFGFKGETMPGDDTFTILKLGDDMACGVSQLPADFDKNMPAHWIVYFGVNNAEAAAAAALAGGGAVIEAPFDMPYGRMAILADPFGAVFSVVAPSQGATA